MSDNTTDRKIKHLKMLARKTGVTLSPARLRALRRKLEAEERNQAEQEAQQVPPDQAHRPTVRS
jgi:hypothetical protein